MNSSTNVKFIQLVHIADVKSDSNQYLCGLASDGSIWYTSLHDLEAGWKQIDTPFKVVQLPIPEAPVVVSPPVHVDNFTSVESQRRKPVLTNEPLVLQFHELAKKEKGGVRGVIIRAGLSEACGNQWLNGTRPLVPLFQAALNAMGYELVIRKIEKDGDRNLLRSDVLPNHRTDGVRDTRGMPESGGRAFRATAEAR